MNPAIFLCCFLPLILVAADQELWQIARVLKTSRERRGGKKKMTELIKNYIGKECVIYTMSAQLTGVIKAVEEGWVSVESGKAIEALNLDYIIRIRTKKQK